MELGVCVWGGGQGLVEERREGKAPLLPFTIPVGICLPASCFSVSFSRDSVGLWGRGEGKI